MYFYNIADFFELGYSSRPVKHVFVSSGNEIGVVDIVV